MALTTELITISDVREYRELHVTVSSTKFSGFLKEVQREHLQNLLGDSLWYDFISNVPDGGKYDTLLAGENYTYNEETVYYPGLKPFLIWAWLSKYTIEGNVQHTANGEYDYMPETAKSMERWQLKEAFAGFKQNMAMEENKVKQYLNEKYETYPLWDCKIKKNTTNLNLEII